MSHIHCPELRNCIIVEGKPWSTVDDVIILWSNNINKFNEALNAYAYTNLSYGGYLKQTKMKSVEMLKSRFSTSITFIYSRWHRYNEKRENDEIIFFGKSSELRYFTSGWKMKGFASIRVWRYEYSNQQIVPPSVRCAIPATTPKNKQNINYFRIFHSRNSLNFFGLHQRYWRIHDWAERERRSNSM